MWRNNLIYRILNKYFDSALELRVQSFNLTAFAGMAAGIITGFTAIVIDAGVVNIVINFMMTILAAVLLYIANKKKCYRLCCLITVFIVFMLAFPAMFFAAGGYRSGMPCFFIFAFIFTGIMLEKHERVAALVLEFILYVSCCLVAYQYPELVSFFETELDYVCDVIVGITVSGILLLMVLLLHIRMYDIRQTQIKELNHELEARNDALRQYDSMKSDFLATVAHEIGTPLAVIAASSSDTLDLLCESPLNVDEIIENQHRIERRAMLISGIVTDLTDTAAIENGRLPLKRQPVSLTKLLKNVCDTMFAHLDNNDNQLKYDFQPNLPPIWADPARIEQVMTNLLSNAMRHTKKGIITIKVERKENNQIVSVNDNGEGMDAEMARIALKQYVSSKSDYWRRGIGLYVCRRIIIAHNGYIWINSEKGRGTSVYFSLLEESMYE